MALYNFHRVLITASILFFFGFALYAYRQFSQGGGSAQLAMAAVSAAVALAMTAYLIYFNVKLMRGVRPRGATTARHSWPVAGDRS